MFCAIYQFTTLVIAERVTFKLWSIQVSLKHDWTDGTDGTVKMAHLPVPLARSSANLADEVQMLLSHLSDPAEDFVQAVHCALHRSLCMILYTRQQIKTVVYFHTRFLSVSFNALHYVCPTYYFHCLSACPVCWTLVGHSSGSRIS